jgi:hypothetical protein
VEDPLGSLTWDRAIDGEPRIAALVSYRDPEIPLEVHEMDQGDRAGSDYRDRYDGEYAEYSPQNCAPEDDDNDRYCERCFQVMSVAC